MAVLTVEQLLSGSVLGLTSGLSDLLVLDLDGRRVLYALSRTENLLIEIEVAADGTMTFEDALTLQGTFPAGSAPFLDHVDTNAGNTVLTIAGLPAAEGQSVSLSTSGALGTQQSMAAVGVLVAPVGMNLDGTAGMLSGGAGGGLELYTDTSAGFEWVAGLGDAADRYLADVAASVSFAQGGSTYAATVSASEDGLSIAEVTASGVTHTGALGTAEGLPVDLPSDIDVLQRLNETLLVIAAHGTNSVSVVRMDSGVPVLADHILDAVDTQFLGTSDLSAAVYGDFAFVAVGGNEGGVTLLTVLPGGRMVHLDSIADDAGTALYRLSDVEATVSGTALQIFGSSAWEAGVTRVSYDLSGLGSVVMANGTGAAVSGTSADDQVIGSDVGEALSGGAGNDILLDGAGIDVLTGGPGADLFAMAADGLADTIIDFERGVDKLDLSAFDFLYDVSQLQVTPTGDGAILSHGNEVITLQTADALPLTAADLTTADILNVDRPPFLAVGQDLVGGTGPDTLNGGMGADTILGAGGDDSLSGGFGDDSLLGGAGLDVIDGGGANDTLRGQSEHDTLVGGQGDDLIFGDGGDDVIYGDDWV